MSNASLNVAEAFVKRWPAEKELEMPDIPWLSIDEGILRPWETAVLEWVGSVKPNPPQWEGPEDRPFTNSVKHKMVRGASHLKNFVVASFLVPDLRFGDAVAHLDELRAVGLIGPQSKQGPGGSTELPKVLIIMGSTMSIRACPAMLSTGKVNLVTTWLTWTLGTA